jgi:hypothetical protein
MPNEGNREARKFFLIRMKTKKSLLLFVALALLSTAHSGDMQAQGFLKKLNKALDKVDNAVNKALDKVDTPTEVSKQTEVAGSTVTYSTPHKLLQVNLLGAEMSGNNYVMEFTITNNGEDIETYRLEGNYQGSKAYDNLGNECDIQVIFGQGYSISGAAAQNTLLSGVPAKVKVALSGFGSKATSFAQVRIKAYAYGGTFKPNGDFRVNNLPIVRRQETSAGVFTAAPAFTLTQQGVACLKNGIAFDEIPTACPGLYDRLQVNLVEEDEEAWNEIDFYAGNEKVARMFAPRFIRDFRVNGATIYSSAVSTPEGVYPGMPLAKLATLKDFDADNQGELMLGGFRIGINYEDLTALGKQMQADAYQFGTPWKTVSAACFKAGAKVEYISF